MGKKDDFDDEYEEDSSSKRKIDISKKEFIVRRPKFCSSQEDLFHKITEGSKAENPVCSKKIETPKLVMKDPCKDPKPAILEPVKKTETPKLVLKDPCKELKRTVEPIKKTETPKVVSKDPSKDLKAHDPCKPPVYIDPKPSKSPVTKEPSKDSLNQIKKISFEKINESAKRITDMKKKFKEMDKKPATAASKLTKMIPKIKIPTIPTGFFKNFSFSDFVKKAQDAMSGKGGAGAPGRPMKYPYTFSAKFAQFPIRFYAKNQWIWKYYFVSVAVCLPIFYSINSLANSPGNVAKWAEIRRKEAMEHHH